MYIPTSAVLGLASRQKGIKVKQMAFLCYNSEAKTGDCTHGAVSRSPSRVLHCAAILTPLAALKLASLGTTRVFGLGDICLSANKWKECYQPASVANLGSSAQASGCARRTFYRRSRPRR